MTDAAHDRTHAPAVSPATPLWRRVRLNNAWALSALVLAAVAVLDPAGLAPLAGFAARAFAGTLPFIVLAVTLVACMRAAGAEGLVARAFSGREGRMIVLAALVGGLAPFCSCEVIPFIAALLALGTPLSAVMAFWLSSPLMDPPMFLITASALGVDFALAKTGAAVGMGLLGGAGVMLIGRTGLFDDVLRNAPKRACGCGTATPFSGRPVWRFWQEPERRAQFRAVAVDNALFLSRWLLLAYLLEGVMLAHVPADWIAGVLGGEGVGPIFLGALLGGPAYLNGYAAVPLVAGLVEQGMEPGAAMAFVLAGGVSCIPAAIAVWALVRPRVFAAYLAFAFAGSVLAGIAWSLAA